MKKLIAAATCTLLLGTFALCACGDGEEPKGQIKGNYVEITSSELTEKLSGITTEKLFGDTSADDWRFGVECTSDIEIVADIEAKGGENATPFINLDLEEQSTLKTMLYSSDRPELNNKSIKLQNNNKLKGKLGKSEMLGVDEDIDFDYSINVHADDDYIYLQIPDMSALPLPFEIAAGKFKTPTKNLFFTLADILPTTVARAAEGDSEATDDFIKDYSLKAYIDESDGLKIKLSANKQSLYALLEEMGVSKATAEDFATFNNFAIDLYFEQAESGKFERAGLVVDIDGRLNIKEGDLSEDIPTLSGPVKIKADVAVKSFIGEIILPSAEQLEEYTDISASE